MSDMYLWGEDNLFSFDINDRISIRVIVCVSFKNSECSYVYVILFLLDLFFSEQKTGAKRVLHEVSLLSMETSGKFINCEDGLQIPW